MSSDYFPLFMANLDIKGSANEYKKKELQQFLSFQFYL